MPFVPGGWELIVLLVVIVLIVGPSKAPGIARMLGKGVHEARETVGNPKQEIVAAITGEEPKPKPAEKQQ